MTIKVLINDIGVDICPDKWRKATCTRSKSIQVDTDSSMRESVWQEDYKNLGINQGDGIQHTIMKEKIRNEYYKRLILILKFELTSKQLH